MDDISMFEEISIKPGETLEGDIPLRERFPELKGALEHTEVILFWVYEMRGKGRDSGERHVGWLSIPARSGLF
jgi:hypothetical protein